MPGLAIVTGATGGLGFETARGLVRAGYEVLLTGRDAGRGAAAVAAIGAGGSGPAPRFALLDVARLDSIADFAAGIDRPVAVLVNNAGVMALPRRERTADGFERQFGLNFLGHFALTARLLGRLRGGRVVQVSSLAHRGGRIAFDDLQSERAYDPWTAYRQSKLAMLMFALELHRRSEALGWGVHSTAAHPGWSATRIVVNGVGEGLRGRLMQAGFNALAQTQAEGARPLLHAATAPGAVSGAYYGPCCWNETRGRPTVSRIMPQARDAGALLRLWQEAAVLTRTGAPFG